MLPAFSKIAATVGLLAMMVSTIDAAVVSTASYYSSASSPPSVNGYVELLGSSTFPTLRSISQSFLAETAGSLYSLSITAVARGSAPHVDEIGLTVSLATAVGGYPNVILGSAPVQNVAVLPLGGAFDQTVQQAVADFSTLGIALEAGVSYAMVFTADAFRDSFAIVGGENGYADGVLGTRRFEGAPFTLNSAADIFFDVKVVTIPEPTALALATILFSGLGCVRRRA
jgi:hypothetical protein